MGCRPSREASRQRVQRLALVVASLVLLTACGGGGGAAHRRISSRHPHARHPTVEQIVSGTASRFMNLLVTRAYGAQWSLLGPPAQRQWPSEQARTRMLATKYGRMTLSYTLGTPVPGRTWVSPETLTRVGGLWEVPSSVHLSGGPAQLPGTASDFSSLPLYLSVNGTRASVVGEGAASLDAPVLRPAAVPRRTFTVPALMYHDVAPPPNPANYATTYGYDLQSQLTVPPDQFAQQMAWLSRTGYHAISLDRLADAVYDGLPLPPKPIVITFDDGFLGQYTHARAILQSAGFTATFFICTGLVGWQTRAQQYATWEELRQMAADGFWIEDHTLTDDTTNYGQSAPVLDRLLLSSQQVLVRQVGEPVQFFAYSSVWPYPAAQDSGPMVDNIMPVLAQGGYQLALTDPTDLSNQVRSDQPYQVPRIRVAPGESIQQFAAELAG